MDTEKLVKEAKARFKHKEAKVYLTEKYINRLTFAYQGGSWTADMELISFLECFKGSIILIDNYRNPIKVNVTELAAEARRLYTEVMQEWYDEYQELQNLR